MSGPLVVSGARIGDEHRGRTLPRSWRLVDVAEAAAQLPGVRTVFVLSMFGRAAHGFDAGDSQYDVEVTGSEGVDLGGWRYRVSTKSRDPRVPPYWGAPVDVVIREKDVGQLSGPWRGLSARELPRTFAQLERLLGVAWGSSTGRTAQSMILSTHPRVKGGTLLDREPQIPEVLREGNLELPYHAWRRDLSAAERAAGWLHVFDANAQYVAAWGAVELGHGQPVQVPCAAFDASRAGFWHFAGGLDAMPNPRPDLPAAWLPGREWYSTQTVVRTLEMVDGLSMPVPDAAILWPHRTRFLRATAERLRDARKAAREYRDTLLVARDHLSPGDVDEWATRFVVADAVVEAVKELYTKQTGRFNSGGVSQASGWARPDWGHMIRAQARVNLHRRLEKLGAAPFAIATDGLVFLDDEPDGVKFADRIRLPLGAGLGEFRHEATMPAAGLVDELAGASTGKLYRAIRAQLRGAA